MIAYIIQPLCHISGTEAVIRDLRNEHPNIKEFRYYKGGTYSSKDLKEADIVFIRPHKENAFSINLTALSRGVRKELAAVIGVKTVKGLYQSVSYRTYGAYSLGPMNLNRKVVPFTTDDVNLSTKSATRVLDTLNENMSWEDKMEANNIRTSLSIVTTIVETNPWDRPDTRNVTLEDRINLLTDICTTLRKELMECRQKYQEDIEKIRDEIKSLEDDMLERYKANKQRYLSLATNEPLESYKLPGESLEDAISRVGKTAWQTYNPLNDVYDCAPPTKEYWEAFAEPNKELLLTKKNR